MPSQGQCPGEVLRRSKGCQRPRASHDAPIAASGTADVTCFDTCLDLDGAKPACAYCLAGCPNTVGADDEKKDVRFIVWIRAHVPTHGRRISRRLGCGRGTPGVASSWNNGACALSGCESWSCRSPQGVQGLLGRGQAEDDWMAERYWTAERYCVSGQRISVSSSSGRTLQLGSWGYGSETLAALSSGCYASCGVPWGQGRRSSG